MNKRIIMVPVHHFPGAAFNGIFDRFTDLHIIENLKEKGITPSNSMVYTNRSYLTTLPKSQGLYQAMFAERLSRKTGFMTQYLYSGVGASFVKNSDLNMSSESIDEFLSSIVLVNEALRLFYEQKTRIPNIIIPVEYKFISYMGKRFGNNDFWFKTLDQLPEMGWFADVHLPEDDKAVSDLLFVLNSNLVESLIQKFFKLSAFEIVAKPTLPQGNVIIPEWLCNNYHGSSFEDWLDELTWQLIHLPQTPENYQARKKIWGQLRTKEGLVKGKTFPEQIVAETA